MLLDEALRKILDEPLTDAEAEALLAEAYGDRWSGVCENAAKDEMTPVAYVVMLYRAMLAADAAMPDCQRRLSH